MNLTNEQINILNSDEDIKINAVAGSGKTTTLIEYARTRPLGSKILYLVFNRSVKLEAIKKFSDKGLSNVTVETAHSLAYRDIVVNYRYKIRTNGYKINEISEILDLASELLGQEKITQYVIANHINKFVALFCNSDKRKVQELNYLDVVYDSKAKNFVKFYYSIIENKTRQFLSKMDRGEIEIIHDFYLKKFQLSNPILPYDYILFDEGQDASPAMLDVFIKQKSKKVIVGDTHQQIYGWRYAVNSLEKSDFKSFNLSISFRFNQDIANLAVSALDLKAIINDEYETVAITGKGTNDSKETKAIIARTNLGF